MPILPNDHPVLTNLETAVGGYNPDLFFQKHFGVQRTDGSILVRGNVGANFRKCIRVQETNEVLLETIQKLQFLFLHLESDKQPSLVIEELPEAQAQIELVRKLRMFLQEHEKELIEGRPI